MPQAKSKERAVEEEERRTPQAKSKERTVEEEPSLTSVNAPMPGPSVALQYLNGEELPHPRIHPVDWKDGQTFSVEDDPDRTCEPWVPPRFVKDKLATAYRQIAKTRVEELDLSVVSGATTKSFARVVYNLFEPEECAQLLEHVNEKGFTPALLNIGRGAQQLQPGLRDGQRVIVDSPELAAYLLELLRPYLPATLHSKTLVELNERCRFLCYTPGQSFDAHCDGRYTRERPHPNAGDHSLVTVQFYLHDVPEAHGGATTFLGGYRDQKRLACQPAGGSALIFTQDLLHEGSLVRAGLKYTLRTEAMYRRPEYTE